MGLRDLTPVPPFCVPAGGEPVLICYMLSSDCFAFVCGRHICHNLYGSSGAGTCIERHTRAPRCATDNVNGAPARKTKSYFPIIRPNMPFAGCTTTKRAFESARIRQARNTQSDTDI